LPLSFCRFAFASSFLSLLPIFIFHYHQIVSLLSATPNNDAVSRQIDTAGWLPPMPLASPLRHNTMPADISPSALSPGFRFQLID
jgi:hypothetical protein